MMHTGWSSEKKKVDIGRLIKGFFRVRFVSHTYYTKILRKCARLYELCVLPTPCAPQAFSTLGNGY